MKRAGESSFSTIQWLLFTRLTRLRCILALSESYTFVCHDNNTSTATLASTAVVVAPSIVCLITGKKWIATPFST